MKRAKQVLLLASSVLLFHAGVELFVELKSSPSVSKLYRGLWSETDSTGWQTEPGVRIEAVSSNFFETISLSPLLDEQRHRLQSVSHRLEGSILRYYMYDDHMMTPQNIRKRVYGGVGKKLMVQRYGGFAKAELAMLAALENHTQRTRDPAIADLYFIPISISSWLTQTGNSFASEAFDRLYNSSIFRQTMGHRHVLLTQTPPVYSYEHAVHFPSNFPHFRRLWNVTRGCEMDQQGLAKFAAENSAKLSDPLHLVAARYGAMYLTRSGFSLGFFCSDKLPLLPASHEKFHNASVEFFYRTTPASSLHNSTVFRHALVKNNATMALANSSIGFNIPAEQWAREFTSSRFCFVIRGDNAQSRALLRSIRVGCIPVIVSDIIPHYAPTFKSSIRMHDYAIFLDEKTFVEDTMAALSFVRKEMEDPIKLTAKLEGLAFAQRLFFPDHPESLFVPALLHEAYEAWKHGIANFPNFPYGELKRTQGHGRLLLCRREFPFVTPAVHDFCTE